MSIGYEDPAVNYIRTGRAPLDETVAFVDDESPGLRKMEHSTGRSPVDLDEKGGEPHDPRRF
jgi:hypothetical protein